MENIQEAFRTFLHHVVLPQNRSYYDWINPENSAERIDEIKNELQRVLEGYDPFEIDLYDKEQSIRILKENLKQCRGTSFETYNKSARNGIPKALLNTHLPNFIRYYKKEIVFSVLQEIVDQLHTQLGTFCRQFQEKRIHYNGQSKPWSVTKIFGNVRDDYWTINTGSEKEIQYHMFHNKNTIGYGLAFNAQPSINNTQPVEAIQPFIEAYFKYYSQIRNLLPDYHYIAGSEDILRTISSGNFVCFGKTIPLQTMGDNYVLNGLSFLQMVYTLQNNQYKAYQTIFEGKVALTTNTIHKITMQETNLLKYKHQIILQGAPGTGKTYTAKNIAEELIFGSISSDKKIQADRLESTDQFKLVQFHPSYTYEDFVRGIVVETEDNTPQYIYQNKILGKFIALALQNYEDSQKPKEEVSREQWVDMHFQNFIDQIEEQIGVSEHYILTENVYVCGVDEDALRYRGTEGWSVRGNRMLFKDIKQAWLDGNQSRQDIKKNMNLSGLARQHASYYVRILNNFQEYLTLHSITYHVSENLSHLPLKEYVLIIDEINRANLPAVLGELIYALEYRGEKVESLYAVEGDNALILPPNLYIIGTMNTADRSVGQIDYAIRRRFAFVDVPPQDLSNDLKEDFRSDYYEKVKALFTWETHLSKEFNPQDVQLGHSYFIQQYEKDSEGNKDFSKPIDFRLRLDYEIKPILREYIKDGILKESARKEIEEL